MRAWIVALLAGWVAAATAADIVPDAARKYQREYIRIVHSEWGLNAPTASLAAQIHAESSWNCSAASSAGAKGCAQFMPTTASWIGDVDRSLRGGDVFSSSWAFRAQAVYMRWLHDRVKGSAPCERMAFALAAYNGGLGFVYRRQAISRDPGRCFSSTCDINPGIAAASQAENSRYPRRVLLELEPLYSAWGTGSC